jgi:hypothetical protein
MQIRDSGFVTLILIMALLYIISPIDVIPDVIPVFGCIHHPFPTAVVFLDGILPFLIESFSQITKGCSTNGSYSLWSHG